MRLTPNRFRSASSFNGRTPQGSHAHLRPPFFFGLLPFFAGVRFRTFFLLSLVPWLVTNLAKASAQVAVWTQHYDNARTGQNTNETALTLSNVKASSFGRLFTHAVDGYVYAQPLCVPNISVPNKGTHNLLIIATEHDSVYAFDADDSSGLNAAPLWQASFINPGTGVMTVPNNDVGTGDIVPEIGVTSTPVIDLTTGTLYVEAKTKEPGSVYRHRLHALDISTGGEKLGGPIIIQATVSGTGDGNNNAGHVPFNALRQMNRPGLLLLNGVVYIGYASHGDNGPYHGWVLGYDAKTLAPVGVYNTTPNGGLGGIWQAGTGLAADDASVYFETGNGTFNTNYANPSSYGLGDSFIKLNTTGISGNVLSLADYFTPYNQSTLDSHDTDLGSGGNVLLPDEAGSAAHPHLLVGSGKEGRIYLLDRDKMGHFNAANDSQIVQWTAPGTINGAMGAPAYFNHTLYYLGCYGDHLKAFRLSNGTISATPVSQARTANFGFPGSSPVVSANGENNAIVWVLQNDGFANPQSTPQVLHAYNATNLTQELYTSAQAGLRDQLGGAVKFTVPTVANGKVYVGSQGQVSAFGLAFGWTATPTITPNGGVFNGSATVTISDTTAGSAIYYTLDGSVPTTSSLHYTVPFIVNKSATLKALAVKSGLVDSPVVTVKFLDSQVVGTGTGLTGRYWSNQLRTTNGAPTLTRIDPEVNFSWGSGSPDPRITADHFTVLWTGQVQPQFSETYTFTTTTDDGVRLWVNSQLLIDEWTDQGPTPWSAAIALTGGQRYDLRMAYYENGGGATAQLRWSSPSATEEIIPQNQLYPTAALPPTVQLTSPNPGDVYTGDAAVIPITATSTTDNGAIQIIQFYAGTKNIGVLTNSPYSFSWTKVAPGAYTLTAVVTDTSGLMATSGPVSITIKPASGQPYGLTNRLPVTPFLNMPPTGKGAIPAKLSQTGAFMDLPTLAHATGLIPYNVNVPLWSDGATKSRWMAVPNNGAPFTPASQIGFATNGEWTFPAGTVFVKHFELVTDETNPGIRRRLETRLLVRDTNNAVYGVTYKWRPDNSEADLVTSSLTEQILITSSAGVRTQTWYYPSPQDCLTCHTPAANYVLGVKARQLNGDLDYPDSGRADNQLRTLNQLGLFNPPLTDESVIDQIPRLSPLTNTAASLEERARSYLDANCAQCHRPGGAQTTFDAQYDTPLAQQNLINTLPVKGNLGYDRARIIVPQDPWRSVLWDRMNSLDPLAKMPPLARNLVDQQAVAALADWINSLPGTPALPPPTVTPPGGTAAGSVTVTLQDSSPTAQIRYTLDGFLPTTNSTLYASPLVLTSSSVLMAKAFAADFNDSVATTARFDIEPAPLFAIAGFLTDGQFHLTLESAPGKTYLLQSTTNLSDWTTLSTNVAPAGVLQLSNPAAANAPFQFFRVLELP
jgi:uncharacterized repeat protein (TIGR03806 family)